MRKIIIAFTVFTFAACAGNAERKEEKQSGKEAKRSEKVYQEGLALVTENRCLTCHTIEDRLTGPSYREIAVKYAGYPDTIISHLARRVIAGGNGVWGEVRMTPHPKVSQKDAEAMVRYVLMLKSK